MSSYTKKLSSIRYDGVDYIFSILPEKSLPNTHCLKNFLWLALFIASFHSFGIQKS